MREPRLRRGYSRLCPPSHRHEYLRWIGEAKRAETRRRRATKAAEMMVDKHGEARPSLP